jgi:polysaccharide export outer membrane protein
MIRFVPRSSRRFFTACTLVVWGMYASGAAPHAQDAISIRATAPQAATEPVASSPRTTGVTPPAGYVIGPEDVLSVVFWREPDVSGEVVVRPDGMISLPLLQDVHAVGLTPEQLAARLVEEAKRYLEAPVVTVTIKQVNSRKVFITGEVQKPGTYALGAPTTVLQLIAMAGGLLEFADSENITIVRVVNGRPTGLRFNYKVVSQRKAMDQNIFLEPGDTLIVP